MAVIAVATAVLGWLGIISRDWAGIALIIVTAFWLNTVWELHKESQKNSEVTTTDEEVLYALNVDRAKASFTRSGADGAGRNYRLSVVVENTSSFPLRVELTRGSVLINDRGPDADTTWTVSSHILQAHKSVEVPLPDITGLVQSDMAGGAQCTGLMRFQRPGTGKYYRCEFDLTATPDDYDVDGWPKKWITVLNREIDYGDWV
jgi:hypothetical protein